MQPLAGEVLEKACGLRVVEHPLDLRPQVVPQLAAARQSGEFVVRQAQPQQVGKPRGKGELVDGVHRFRVVRLWLGLGAEQEARR